MNIKNCTLILGAAVMLLAGCAEPPLRAMGVLPVPTTHQPRLDPTNKDSEMAVSLQGYGLFNNYWRNVEDIYGGGASVSGTYRFGGFFSPLFVSVGLNGFGGHLNFTCDKENKCGDTYLQWLDSDEGEKSHTFWGLQEQALLGLDFHFVDNVFIGFGGGVLTYQSGGDYEKYRNRILKNDEILNKDRDDVTVIPLAGLWFGYHFGPKGKYGTLSIDAFASTQYIYEDLIIFLPVTASYHHPSGFYGGVGTMQGNVDVFVGKTFVF